VGVRWKPSSNGDVLFALAWARLRDQRDFTASGIAKWILDPPSFTFVYFLLFAVVLARPQFAYLLFLFCALVPWRFFTGTLGASMSLVHSYAAPLTRSRVWASSSTLRSASTPLA
jgi:ABC-type polysaccharide/polyol phosphate export permease